MADAFSDHLAIWDRLAEEDAFWAVLSDPAKRGGAWDPDTFFATGHQHITALEEELQGLGHTFAGRRALDFGCGLGRLTQAVAGRASFALGIDASVGMVVGAQRWNRLADRCAYLLNRSPDLSMLPDRSFGAVVSFIVLQHIPPPASHRYLAELGRVVGPGGFLVVQVPAEEVVDELPATGFAARLRLVEVPPRMSAGDQAEVAVEVTNDSQEPWRPRPPNRLRVGNHWVSLDGGPSVRDDGRVVLDPLEPAATAVVRLPVTAPGMAGRYRLEADVVVEGQAWFADRGARPATAEVEVGPSRPAAPVAAATTTVTPPGPVTFGMFGVPRDEVVAILEGQGLRMLAVTPDGSSGDAWTSWRYLATR